MSNRRSKLEKAISALKAFLVFVAVLLGTYYLFELGKAVFGIHPCSPCPNPPGDIEVYCEACLIKPVTAVYILAQPIVSFIAAVVALITYNNKVRRSKIYETRN